MNWVVGKEKKERNKEERGVGGLGGGVWVEGMKEGRKEKGGEWKGKKVYIYYFQNKS